MPGKESPPARLRGWSGIKEQGLPAGASPPFTRLHESLGRIFNWLIIKELEGGADALCGLADRIPRQGAGSHNSCLLGCAGRFGGGRCWFFRCSCPQLVSACRLPGWRWRFLRCGWRFPDCTAAFCLCKCVTPGSDGGGWGASGV